MIHTVTAKITDFGAVPGVDCRAAVIAAELAVVNAGGGTVLYPAGTWLARTPPGNRTAIPVTHSRVTHRGESRWLTTLVNDTIHTNGGGDAVFAMGSPDGPIVHVGVEDMTVQNAGEYLAEDAGLALINLLDSRDVIDFTLRRVVLDTPSRTGWKTGGRLTGYRLEDVTVTGRPEAGLYFAGYCTDGYVVNCHVASKSPHPGSVGYSIRGAHGLTLAGCHASGYALAQFDVRGDGSCSDVSIVGGSATAPLGAGYTDCVLIDSVDGVTIQGIKTHGGAAGIRVTAYQPVKRVRLRDNEIRDALAGITVGAYTDAPEDVDVSGNDLNECRTGTIVDGAIGQVTVDRNRIEKVVGTGHPGLYILRADGATSTLVRHNRTRNYVNLIYPPAVVEDLDEAVAVTQ